MGREIVFHGRCVEEQTGGEGSMTENDFQKHSVGF